MKNNTVIVLTVVLFGLSALGCFIGVIAGETSSSEPAVLLGSKLGTGLGWGFMVWGILAATVFSVVAVKVIVKEIFFKRG